MITQIVNRNKKMEHGNVIDLGTRVLCFYHWNEDPQSVDVIWYASFSKPVLHYYAELLDPFINNFIE